ncbi:MAG: helix-turn-helix domain-containing protein [Thermoleophilia bacterium]
MADTLPDPDLVAFGDRLRELRTAAGLTQEALAAKAGLHWTFVSQCERGVRNISLRNLLRIARGLGVPPSELMPDR